jgi:hypothetical protein
LVAISQALETAIAVIIFIVLAMMFFSVFGSTECDKLSNTTAIELTNAINKVALEYGVEPWTGEGVPTNDKPDNYVSVPIRLCEKNMINSFAAQFEAQQPTYILTYEIFPEEGYAWSESQPFSGGAAESVLNYLIMSRGIKAITYASKYVTKAIKKVGSWVKTAIFKGGASLLGVKITKFLDAAKNNRVIKWILKRLGSSAAQEPIEENTDDLINSKYYKSKWKGLIEDFKKLVKDEDLDEERALVKLGVYKEGPDGLALTLGDKKVVAQEYRGFILNFIENKGDAAKAFANDVYVPPAFPWLSTRVQRIKANYWQPLKNRIKTWWQKSSIKHYLYDTPKNFYNRVKGGYQDAKSKFNEIFNYKDGMTDVDIMQEEIGVVTGIAKENNEEILQGMKKKFDKFKDELEDLYQGNKIFQSAEDITSADVDLYIDSFNKWGNLNDLTKFTPREIDLIDQSSIAQRKMGSTLREAANEVKDAADKGAAYNDFQSMAVNSWDDLPQSEGTYNKNYWIKKFSSGYTNDGKPLTMAESEVKKAYEYARMSMANEGLFDRTKMFANGGAGPLRVSQLIKKTERVEREMLSASYKMYSGYSTERIIDFLSTPYITNPSALDKIPRSAKIIGTEAWQTIRRQIFLDTNRIGQANIGPIPTIAPYNILNSPYSIKQALKKESQIQEGGCASQSICKLQRGKAEGPTETATAYLLDRKVPSSINVKLWRQNPSIGLGEFGLAERTPAGISTALFSTSVTENPRFYVASPCFAVAKVWKDKSKNTVFISIDKGNKCDVSGCEQPNLGPYKIPWLSDIPFLGQYMNIQVGLSPIDTPNYCYADEEFIWGEDDSPSQVGYYSVFAGLTAICTAATWMSGGTAFKACLKGAGYATIGILMVNVVAATQAYRDVPSWERQETGWGYWNYLKAEDICDNVEIISSFGSFSSKSITAFAKKHKTITNVVKKVSKVGKVTGTGVDDLCYGIMVIGDTSLSWSIKTPVGEVWKKASTLNDKCMQESAAKCVWLEKCDPLGADPSLIACPVGYVCDPEERICKKSS